MAHESIESINYYIEKDTKMKFKVGDVVSYNWGNNIEYVGEILELNSATYSVQFGTNFDGHDCNSLDNRHGWFCDEDNLSLVYVPPLLGESVKMNLPQEQKDKIVAAAMMKYNNDVNFDTLKTVQFVLELIENGDYNR